ncbi:MAG: hypothetical protein PHY47_18510 [Lachnospiraceae bacterium]|nr:hypothetical protein [Lachnospiraceae bacterium]
MYKNNMQVQRTINEEGFYNLAEAIILQAVKDYRYALRTLKKYTYSLESNKVKSNVERFFRSKWYSELTNIDGKILIKKLREEVK